MRYNYACGDIGSGTMRDGLGNSIPVEETRAGTPMEGQLTTRGVSSFVPAGLDVLLARGPSDESLGYDRTSLAGLGLLGSFQACNARRHSRKRKPWV